MSIYVLPNSAELFNDRFFEKATIPSGGRSNIIFWNEFNDALRRTGFAYHTYDRWSPEKAQPGDILIVINHPGETLVWRIFYYLKHFKIKGGFILSRRKFLYDNYRYFGKRILLQAEPPMVMPYVYKALPSVNKQGIYTKILLICKGFGEQYGYFNNFSFLNHDITSPYFGDPKSKFLVMINTNVFPHSLVNEFYGERLKAIKYFSQIPGFDLYGYRWDKFIKHPLYLHYGKYVRRVWRGTTPDKIKTLSEYKFCLCFENCAYPGYMSEKIFDCLAAGCIPIYLGAPDIESIVPKFCFIDFRKFKNYNELNHFLSVISDEELTKYRAAIASFLKNRPGKNKFDEFMKELI